MCLTVPCMPERARRDALGGSPRQVRFVRCAVSYAGCALNLSSILLLD
jgi:hypothetical protein